MARGTEISSSIPDAGYDPAVGEDIPSDLPDDQNLEGDPDFEVAAEARAIRMGWVPFAQFRGPAERWTKASIWLQKADEVMPIMRNMNHSLETKLNQATDVIASLKQTVEAQNAAITDLRNLAKRADDRGYQRALKDIADKKLEAVAAGDTAGYTNLVAQEEALVEAREEVMNPQPDPRQGPPSREDPPPPRFAPEVTQFITDNPWWNRDPTLTSTMTALHTAIINEGQIADLGEQLVEAKRRLMMTFPERFPAPRRQSPNDPPPRERRDAGALEPRGPQRQRQQPDNQPGLSIVSIPDPAERAQAREQYQRQARATPGFKEAEFMEIWNDPHADVLAIQEKYRSRA